MNGSAEREPSEDLAPVPEEKLHFVMRRARAAAADFVSVEWLCRRQTEVTVRHGAKESMEQAADAGIGVCVWKGGRRAFASTTDLREDSLGPLTDSLVARCGYLTADPFGGPIEADRMHPLGEGVAEALRPDPETMSPADLWDYAHRTEATACSAKGVSFSEGATAARAIARYYLANSGGFAGGVTRKLFSASVAVGALSDGVRELDYAETQAVRPSLLTAPQALGALASARLAARGGAGSVGTFQGDVVFAPRAARTLLGMIINLLSAEAVLQGRSFLKAFEGQKLFSEALTVMEDPLDPAGVSSRPFDHEAVLCRPLCLVKDGHIRTWLHTLSTARRMEAAPTGHGMGSLGALAAPAASNVSVVPSRTTEAELIADVRKGVYVTDLIGSGLNPTTGDYSQGAAGFLIEKGSLGPPVKGFALAASFRDMLGRIRPADNLDRSYRTASPSLLVPALTIAGSGEASPW